MSTKHTFRGNPATNAAGRYSAALKRWEDSGRKGPPPPWPKDRPLPYRDQAVLAALQDAIRLSAQPRRKELETIAAGVREFGLRACLEYIRANGTPQWAAWLEDAADKCEAVVFQLSPAEIRRREQAEKNRRENAKPRLF
jgi:hypothetical protein